jgi:hypothetical protein
MSLKDQHFSSAPDSASAQSKYQVQAGDTLRSLALAFYGNSDYWYLIANSNGLTGEPDKALSAGLVIDIPARADSRNSYNSFKPMDLQQIIGDTTPAVPYLPPPPRAGCNALAMVVMIAITAVAAVATAGVAAGASGSLASIMQAGATAMMGGGAVTGSALAGLGALGGATAAAAGGFVGSVVGQLAGKAMGVVDSFSLKNAFASGLTAGATAGMGKYLQSTSWAMEAGKLGAAGKMALAASSAGISVAANKLAGNQASFQWRNVVTGATTAGLMHGVGLTDIGSQLERFAGDQALIGGTLQGIAGAAIGYGVSKGLYNEGGWNFRNVAQDAFGNALGNSIVSKLSQPKGYQIGDEITVDGQKGYVAGVDESGKPTSISHSAEGLRAERQQLDYWRDYDNAQEVLKAANLTPSMLTFDHQDPSQILHNARSVAAILDDKQKVAAMQKQGLDVESLRRTYVAGLASEDVYLNYSDKKLDLHQMNSMKQALGAFGVSRLDEAALKELGIKGSRLVNEDIGYYSALYHDKTRDTYMLANRGTNDLLKDGPTNLANSYGYVAKQYDFAVSLADKLADIGTLTGKLSFTGHSLGGGLASAQAVRVGGTAITFNAAGLSSSVASKLNLSLSDANRVRIQANYLQGDIVSVAQDHWSFDLAAFATTPAKYGVAIGSIVTGQIGLKDFDFTPGYVPQAFGTRVQLQPGNSDWNSLTRHSQTAVLQTLSQQIYRFGGGK